MDSQTVDVSTVNALSATVAEKNGNAIGNAQEAKLKLSPMGKESHGQVTALHIFARLARFSALIALTRQEYQHIGKDVLKFAESHKLATREAIFSKLSLDLALHCKERGINPDSMKIDKNAFERCLDCEREAKQANKLNCFNEWKVQLTDSGAKRVLSTAKGERQKKKAEKPTALNRAAKIISEEIYGQEGIETLALELFKGLKDVKTAKSIQATLENIIKRLEATIK